MLPFLPFCQDLPDEFGVDFAAELMPSVRIRGVTLNYFHVDVENRGTSLCFASGWESFVEAEKICRGDRGIFVLVAPNKFEFRLLGRNGLFKPLSARPACWNFLTAVGDEIENTGAAPAAPQSEPQQFIGT